jgi:hypothetical protein
MDGGGRLVNALQPALASPISPFSMSMIHWLEEG